MDPNQSNRYLGLLAVGRSQPSLLSLTDLVIAHLARAPFENVSKLIRFRRGEPPSLPPLDRYLDGIEHAGMGGTCYALNGFFGELLNDLGYETRICGCTMDRSNAHVVNVVTLGGREYLVDVGFAAPFVRPLPLDLEHTIEIAHGPDRYVLQPRGADNETRLEHHRDGRPVHGYTLDPTARVLADFDLAIADTMRPDSLFLNQLRIVRHDSERSVFVRDATVAVLRGGQWRERTMPSRAALKDVLTVLVDIRADMLDEAMASLGARVPFWRGFP